MTALTTSAIVATTAVRSGPLLGLANLIRKDLREWVHGRRLWVVLILSTSIYALTAANARINAWVLANLPAGPGETPPRPMSLVPMDNLLLPIGTQFAVLIAIFATMSLIVSEREGGTLAWTVSKPVARASVLVSKWLSATLLVWLTAVVLPLAATAALVTVLYGPPDIGATAIIGAGLIGMVALFVAISLTAATFIPSQGGIAAIGLACLFGPSIIGGVVPGLTSLLPTAIQDWTVSLALGGTTPIVTPIAWLLALAVLFVVARRRFAAMEL